MLKMYLKKIKREEGDYKYMEKPLILAIEETKQEMLNLIVESGVPAFFLLQIIQDIERQLVPIKEKELENVKANFESKSKKSNTQNKKEGIK